jgi:2-hydroxychromene-2-carboxylate isomerase
VATAGAATARTMSATGKPGGAKAAGSRPAQERQAHAAMTAAVAQALHVSTARVSAALRPLFAAGHAETSSPAFAAAARSLGVSAQQLNAALIHAKESLAAGS